MAPRSGAARASLEPEVADSVILNISSVIKFGAPMFNKGDAEGCSKLYKQTAMNIVRDAAVTSEEIKATLREAVAKSESIVAETGDQKSAWALREGLDTVVDLILEPPSDEPMLFKATKESTADEEEKEEAQDPTGASTPVVNEAALFDFAASPQMASVAQSQRRHHGRRLRRRHAPVHGRCVRAIHRGGSHGEQRRVRLRARLFRQRHRPLAV